MKEWIISHTKAYPFYILCSYVNVLITALNKWFNIYTQNK